MRRNLLCIQATPFLIGLALLTLTTPTLWGQDSIVGDLVEMPEVSEINGSPAVLALQDGTFLVATRIRSEGRITDVHMFTVDPDQGDLLAWERPAGINTQDIRLVATDPSFAHVENPQDPELGIESRLSAQFQDPATGEDLGVPITINPAGSRPTLIFDAARLQNGHLVAAWADGDPAGDGSQPGGTFFQIFTEDGELIGPLGTVGPLAQRLRVTASTTGGFLVTWQAGATGTRVLGRAFDTLGIAESVNELVGLEERVSIYDIAPLPQGRFMLVWADFNPDEPSNVYARRIAEGALPFPETLDVGGSSGSGQATPKVMSDRFGRSWVTWQEVPGNVFLRQIHSSGTMGNIVQIPPRADGAFQYAPQIAVDDDGQALVVWLEPLINPRLQARTVTTHGSCMADDTVLCLDQGRFRVEIEWTAHDGQTGEGRVVPFQSADSGIFWFFNAANWEVMVKVINGCDFNGFYWIFSAATTDVSYILRVTDTVTGLHQLYFNPLGEPAPANTDTMALMSCDHGPP